MEYKPQGLGSSVAVQYLELQVKSLIGGLRFHRPCDMAKTKTNTHWWLGGTVGKNLTCLLFSIKEPHSVHNPHGLCITCLSVKARDVGRLS